MNLSGLAAIIIGLGVMILAFLVFLVCFIIAMVFRSTSKRGVFKQKAGAFIVGSFVQLFGGLFIFLSGTELISETSSERREMDELCLYFAGFTLLVTIGIIIGYFVFVSKKYYPRPGNDQIFNQ